MDTNRERNSFEAEVTRLKSINRALCSIAASITETDSLMELYRKIHSALSLVIDTTNIFIAHYNQDEDSISFPYIIDTVDYSYPKTLNISRTASLTAQVVKSGEPLLIRNTEILAMRQNLELNIPQCTPAAIWLGAPLRTVKGIIGVLAVQSYTNTLAYDETDKEVLVSVADMVAIAIERKRTEDALQESMEKYMRIVTTVNAGILSMDHLNQITFANKYLCEMLGYTNGELVGKSFEMLLDPDEIADFNRRQNERSKGTSEQFERKFKTKDGANVWTIISASPLWDNNGNIVGSFGSITNITERKEMEMALHLKNLELQDALRQIKTLRGIVPICMHCKKVRDDKGFWNQVEVYVRDRTQAEFSHSLCPECMAKHYQEYLDNDE